MFNLLSISHSTFHDYDYENTKQFSGNNLTNIVYLLYNKEKKERETYEMVGENVMAIGGGFVRRKWEGERNLGAHLGQDPHK